MFSLKKLCFVPATQRCFKSEDLPSDFTMNLSSLPPSKGGGSTYITTTVSPPRTSDLSHKRLLLTVEETEGLHVGLVYLIDHEGLRGSARLQRDGRVYAGYDDQANDIVLPKSEFGIGSVHFVIEFNSMSGQFLIKDQGDGTGTFVKLDRPILLQSYYILSFGNTHMTVVIAPQSKQRKITLKFIEGPKAGQCLTFDSGQKVVKIGRLADCEVQFDDTSLSRYQCTLRYKENEGWYASDGDGTKPSTNGTWLFLDDYFPIETDMAFKAGMTVFRVRHTQASILSDDMSLQSSL